MIGAIKLLFTEMLMVSWSHSFAWDDWMQKADALSDGNSKSRLDEVKSDESVLEQGF